MTRTFRIVLEATAVLAFVFVTLLFLSILSSIVFFAIPGLSDGAALKGLLQPLWGTLKLVGLSALIAVPVAVGAALGYQGWLSHSRYGKLFDYLIFFSNGIPSILWGILGLAVLCRWLGWGISLGAGVVVLAVMIVPVVVAAILDYWRGIASEEFLAAKSLGLRRSHILGTVCLPRLTRPLGSSLMVALGRIAGETAPILFTAAIFSGATGVGGWFDPVDTLPTRIFIGAQESVDPAAASRVFLAALLLLVLCLGLHLPSAIFREETVREEKND